jgi:membrane-associated phospholipid phosphatase
MQLPTRRTRALAVFFAAAAAAAVPRAHAAGGPLGIDHRLNADDSGIWKRSNQTFLQNATLAVVAGGALWEGSDTRLGKTFWQSVDSVALGILTAESMKVIFARTRPRQSDDPNLWFQGSGNKSFPSGEVMQMTTAITPFVLEYGAEHPAVWALELLPLYDGIARVKVRAHWQSDVLASFAIGSALGYWAHSRSTSLSVGVLPRGVTIGWKTTF